MSEKLNTYDAIRYPIVIQVLNGQVVASQPDLDIYRVRGKFCEIKKREEIGSIVLDVMEEVVQRLKTQTEVPTPSLPSKAIFSSAPVAKTVRTITTGYAGKLAGVALNTVTRMCERGELDFKLTPKGHRRIYLTEKNLRALNVQM